MKAPIFVPGFLQRLAAMAVVWWNLSTCEVANVIQLVEDGTPVCAGVHNFGESQHSLNALGNTPETGRYARRLGQVRRRATAPHDDVIKWKHLPCYWSFVRGIHRSPVDSLHKGKRRGALMFSLICAWINGWLHNRGAGDLRRHRDHYDVTVMSPGLVSAPESSWVREEPHCSTARGL